MATHTATPTMATSDLVDSILEVVGPSPTSRASHSTSDAEAPYEQGLRHPRDRQLRSDEEYPADTELACDAVPCPQGHPDESENATPTAAKPAHVRALVLGEPEEECGDGLDGQSGEIESMSPLPPFRVCHPGAWGARVPLDLDPCGPKPVYVQAAESVQPRVDSGSVSTGGGMAVPQLQLDHRVRLLYPNCLPPVPFLPTFCLLRRCISRLVTVSSLLSTR